MRLRFAYTCVLLLAAAAQAQQPACLDCHSDRSLTKEAGGRQVSVWVDAAAFQASVHGALGCGACHSDVKDYPHEPAPKPVSCAGCHPEADAQYRTGVHARLTKNGVPAASCVSCHGKHDILPKTDSKSRTFHMNVAPTCAQCHPKEGKPFDQSIHGRGIRVAGLLVSATCSDCHKAHDTLPQSDPRSTVARSNLPNTCSRCHLGILNDFVNSTHGELWRKGDSRGPVCSTCHSSHSIRPASGPGFQLSVPLQCGRCHKEETPSYRDTFHGKATSLGMAVAAKCSDCHTPHHNLPKSNPASSIAGENRIRTCARCHPEADANFASYDPHPNPANRNRSAAVYYVHQFMKWLLIGVFGFFGVHTALWLQRAIVAWVRKEIPVPRGDEQYVVRFALKHRLTHLVIILSFLGLAATGLPLRYHDEPWGRMLSTALGGLEVSRFFHRVWAAVTFGYAFYHLGFLLHRIFVRKDLAILRGPESLMPRWQDAIDLWNNVRWFLYLGSRPSFGRWTYWEKFDYFAVFWGVPVIGISGLALWQPTWFTKFLPGVFLNIAAVIHGEEALLAVGFIFAFHFFHTHLRPESFPVDTVMFTGKLPLSRFREERREEYERLVREGKLESLLAPPPSQILTRLSVWLGLAAVSVGFVLVAAIFFTYLAG